MESVVFQNQVASLFQAMMIPLSSGMSNEELEHDHGEFQPDALLGDTKLGMTFDTKNEV